MKACVDRILEQYDILQLYFQNAAFEDHTHTHDSILRILNNKFTKAYLEFMSFNLGRLVSCNLFFQSEQPLLQLLKQQLSDLVSSLSLDFIHCLYIRETDIDKINPKQNQQYIPVNKVYIGIVATGTLNSITQDIGENHPDVQMFFSHCREFLMKCVRQIQFKFHDLDRFDFLECLGAFSDGEGTDFGNGMILDTSDDQLIRVPTKRVAAHPFRGHPYRCRKNLLINI